MPAPLFLAKLPRPALFALTGALAGLLAALTAGELVWYLLRPSPSAQRPDPRAEPYTAPMLVPAPSGPQLAVSAAPVTAYPGGKNTFGVRVARDKFDGPVTVRFDAPGGPSAAELSIAAADAAGRAEIVVPPEMKPGTYVVTATASALVDDRTIRASVSVQVTVPALPPPPPRMAVSTSPKVQAYQRGKNTFAVRVERSDFDDEITVAFEDLPHGVTIPAITVPAGKTEATAELTADDSAKLGSAKVTMTARAAPKGVATSAAGEIVAEILDPSKAPLDLVLVLDCTGSMRKSVDALGRSLPTLDAELRKARFDTRYGVVGFRDTTLGQKLEEPNIGDERMNRSAARFAEVVGGLRLGGGGGEGESSLDGLARAAEYPLRGGGAARVLLLVTDGPPKRFDGRIKSTDAAVQHLRARQITQLHVVALPEHLKRFEPLWAGPKGKYFDLKAANEENTFDKLMVELGKTITDAVPPQPVPKPEPSATAAATALPQPTPVKPPDPPAAPEAEEPRFAPPVPPAPPPTPEATENQSAPESTDRKPLARTTWASTVTVLACLALFLGQWTFLPGERPTAAVGAAGYGGGLVLGVVAGALGYVALDALDVPLLTRFGSAGLFGLWLGMTIALAERLLSADADADAPEPLPLPPPPPPALVPVPELDLPAVEVYPAPSRVSPARPLPELDLPPVEAHSSAPANAPPSRAPLLDDDLPPVEAYPSASANVSPPLPPPTPRTVPVHKPNITGVLKPGDGCPKCGRKIPGEVGTRYCMLCDETF